MALLHSILERFPESGPKDDTVPEDTVVGSTGMVGSSSFAFEDSWLKGTRVKRLGDCLTASLSPSFGLAYTPSTPSCLSTLFSGCFRRRYRGLSYSLSNDLPPPSEFWP